MGSEYKNLLGRPNKPLNNIGPPSHFVFYFLLFSLPLSFLLFASLTVIMRHSSFLLPTNYKNKNRHYKCLQQTRTANWTLDPNLPSFHFSSYWVPIWFFFIFYFPSTLQLLSNPTLATLLFFPEQEGLIGFQVSCMGFFSSEKSSILLKPPRCKPYMVEIKENLRGKDENQHLPQRLLTQDLLHLDAILLHCHFQWDQTYKEASTSRMQLTEIKEEIKRRGE